MNKERITIKHLAVVASAAAISCFSFWWMAVYTILSVADMLGIMALVYFIALYKGFAAAERLDRKRRKNQKVYVNRKEEG